MPPMPLAHAHIARSSPRAFAAGPLDGLLLRIRCVHDAGRSLDDHADPATFRLEYALIGAYVQRCGHGLDHAVGISTDFVESDAIDESYMGLRRGPAKDDTDRAYWLIDMALVDWADPCDIPEDRG